MLWQVLLHLSAKHQEKKDGGKPVVKPDTIHSLEQQRTMRKYAYLFTLFLGFFKITPYEKVVSDQVRIWA